MDTAAILDGLGNAEGLPEVSIRAARARRGDVAPQLIALVERYVAGDETALAQEKVLFWAFHLLGEWREAAAYRPLARLLALETDEIHEVLGDAVTATAHRVMAGLFDGDPQPLYDVIENQRADSFVRSRMLETLAMLVLDGRLARDAAARYLKLAFARLRPQDSDFVWFGWQSAIAALRLEELSDLVRQAYERELIDPADMGFADFAADLDHARRHPDAPWRSAAPDEFAPFNDTLAEFSTWTFDEDASQPDDDFGADDEWWPDHRVARPAVNPFKDVGRNDPCPCGSGKKFKKCCLG